MEAPRLQELCQVGHHAHIHQVLHIRGRALAELLPLDPLSGVDLTRAIFGKRLGHHDLFDAFHVFVHVEAVLAFLLVGLCVCVCVCV